MVDREGGQWNVGIKSGAVYLERVSEDRERLFDDMLAAQEARDLGGLLMKHADKLGDSGRSDEDGSDAESDKSEDNEAEEGDESRDSDDESDRASN